MNLSTTNSCRLCVVSFRRTSSSTDSITSSTSSKVDNDISRIRGKSLYCTSWSSPHNSTDLHTFCNIIWMVYFFYITSCKSDLVTIRAVSMSSLTNNLLLWKFSFDCIFIWHSRICSTSYTHCLIYVSTS